MVTSEPAEAGAIPDFRALAEALPAMVAISDGHNRLRYVNSLWTQYTGLTVDEIGADRSRIVHPDDLDRVSSAVVDANERAQPFEVDYRIRRHDGAYRWHSWRARPLLDKGGAILAWIGTTSDIEDAKQAEFALRVSRAQHQILDQTGLVMSGTLDADVMMTNLARFLVPRVADIAAVDLLGGAMRRVEVAASNERERHIVEGVHVRDWKTAPGSSETMVQALASGRPVHYANIDERSLRAVASRDEQFRLVEQLHPASALFMPLVARGEILGVISLVNTASGRQFSDEDVAVIRQIASRAAIAIQNARLHEDLKFANAAKDEFLSLVSHELRTPITTIMGNAEILERRFGHLDEAARNTALADIRQESERLQRIVDNLLVLARLDAQGPVQTEPILMQRVIERSAAAHRRRFPGRNVLASIDPLLPPALAAAPYVEQVLANLLSNAEKYSGEEHDIGITAARNTNDVAVRVLDRGVGLTETDMARVFDPFYRSPETAARVQGVGIGLTVCKRLVEAQGGAVWARPRDGGGAEFGFTLPVAPDND